jgi:hypothetical protein
LSPLTAVVHYNDDDGGGGIVWDDAARTTTVGPTRMRPENVVRTPRSHIKVPPPPRARHAGRRRTSAVFGSAGRRK